MEESNEQKILITHGYCTRLSNIATNMACAVMYVLIKLNYTNAGLGYEALLWNLIVSNISILEKKSNCA